MLSFKEIGTPCSGPTTFPVLANVSSKAFAAAIASGNKVAVKQLTYNTKSMLRLDTTCSALTH